MHVLLQDQIRHHLGRNPVGGELGRFIAAVDSAYTQADTDRAAAKAIANERDRLRAAVVAMEHTLGVIGHELRTPLSGMRAMAEMLLGMSDADLRRQRAALLPAMHDEVLHMASMVNDLLEAARLNSGLVKWNWSTVSLAKAVGEAVESARLAVGSNVAAGEDGQAGPVLLGCGVDQADLTMNGDADAVRRLILNLTTNALRHTKQGSVQVRADAAKPGWIEISVKDTGPGIPPARLAQLGRPFSLNSGMIGTLGCGGAGLGLAICNSIAAAHGGRLIIESHADCGTTVRAMLRRDLPGPVEKGWQAEAADIETAKLRVAKPREKRHAPLRRRRAA
jgi:signal transduction histidine kinase